MWFFPPLPLSGNQEACYEAGVYMRKLGWESMRYEQQLHRISMSAMHCEPNEAGTVEGRRIPLTEVLLKSFNPPAPLLPAPTVYILWSHSNT